MSYKGDHPLTVQTLGVKAFAPGDFAVARKLVSEGKPLLILPHCSPIVFIINAEVLRC